MPAEPMPKVVKPPVVQGLMRPHTTKWEQEKRKYDWLNKQMSVYENGELHVTEFVSWAAHHASQMNSQAMPETRIALMPLLRKASHAVAMIKHVMRTNSAATQLLNPGQIPVLTMDQSLYAIGKQIQWRFPQQFGEDKYVIMLGPLHTEMAALKVLGDFLEGSGWCNAISQAKVANKGTADSFLKTSHVTKTRRAHQVTATTLYILQKKAFFELVHKAEQRTFSDWCEHMCNTPPTFMFWSKVLDLELTVLIFVKAIRTADFGL